MHEHYRYIVIDHPCATYVYVYIDKHAWADVCLYVHKYAYYRHTYKTIYLGMYIGRHS